MASFIQGVTDSPQSLQSPLFQQDYGFLQNQLYRSNQQEEQGVQKIATDYSSIVNAPLTDDGNLQKRKEYVSQIQEGLKKIAPTDVSLPQNVAQAENLYSPFWRDTTMLQDMSYTKGAQGELSKLDGWKNSNDKDIRAQYSPDAEDWINQGLTKLKNANRDPSVYNRLQKREAVPFADIDKDVDAAYKDEQQKGIDTTTVSGNGIVTEHNGIKSKDAFKTWYLSKVGSKYDKQLYISESVRVQRAKGEILRQNPGMTEQELNSHFAGEQIDKLNEMYKGNIDSYAKVADTWTKKYDDLYTQIQKQPGKRATQQQVDDLASYQDKVKANQQQATEYSTDFSKYGAGNPNSPEYKKTLQDIAEHPEDYLAGIQKSIIADRWASGMASMNTSTKVELDPRWQAYQTEHDKQLERQIEAQKVSAENWKTELGYRTSTGQTSRGIPIPGFDPRRASGWNGAISNGTGTGNEDGSGIPNPSTGSFTGLATADVAHLPQGLEVITGIQKQNMQRVTDNVYSPSGIAGALSVDGVSNSDIINFTEGAKAGMTGQHPTQVQADAWNRVKKVLSDNGIPTGDIHGPQQMEQALLRYSSIAAQKLLQSGNTDKIKQGVVLINTYQNISEDRDKVITNQRTYDQAVKDEIFNHPEVYKNLVVKNPDGSKRYITAQDMAKDFPSVELGDNNGNVVKTLTPLEFATLHESGKYRMIGQNAIEVNGIVYNVLGVNGSHNEALDMQIPGGSQLAQILAKNVDNKYGTPDEFSKIQQKASAAVIPKLKGFDNGLISQNLSFDPAIKNQLDMAVGISKEVANPANINAAFAYQEGYTPSSTPDQKKNIDAVRGVIFSKDDMSNYTSGPQKTITPEGLPAVAYTFKANGPDKVVGADGVKISELAGKTFVIPLSPNANAPYLNSIPESSGRFIHGDLLYDNKPMISDPTIQASGFKSVIHPYAKVDGKNTKCAIEIQKSIPDVKNPGQTKWVVVDQTDINMLKGPKAKNPDEIVGISNYLLSQHLGNLVNDAKTKEIIIPDNAPSLK